MLIHPCDAASRAEWQALLGSVDFGLLVTAGHVDGYPVVVPKPSTAVGSDLRRLPGIRGLRLHVEGVRAKRKYGGNKTPGHRTVIAARLADRDAPGDREARDHLLRRTDG